MRVLLFGTYDVRSHPRVAVLGQGLRRHGLDVRSLNAPLGIGTAGRVAALQDVRRLPAFAATLLARWRTLAAGALRLRLRRQVPDVVLVGYLGHFDVLLARALFPRTPIVLDHLISAAGTAVDRGERGAVKQRLLRSLDAAALAAADLVVVDTEEHLAALPARARGKGLVVLVGAPDAWYAEPRPRADGPLRVVFFGLFTPLQGAPVVGAALALLAGDEVEATLVGSGQDLEATRRAATGARVAWRDWVDADELPALVADHDVCLGIFGTGEKALRVVPNKVFQGAAAGCAVVTSATPPQQRVLGEAALLVPPGDPGALAEALRALHLDRERLAAYQEAGRRLAETAFRPEAVVAPLARALQERWQDGRR
ncbi:glycosyltransferase involved in cell wall biosynthesis [Motilibacter rhizosphaerae]|uniref:Glycosyltransferase involved in cell wall biosynthesis n=1 Tax=Motilibacter rhizosphaerae TaxID=598652 RepID=A0A4Q7NSR1_9ACTN|nr:glycosyltransferase [Motilibacter rhizosphaerae]RZS90183.1 glycosyltransferase involved in cell wall biosynthesis [Motilibacter rhizosphaerae]